MSLFAPLPPALHRRRFFCFPWYSLAVGTIFITLFLQTHENLEVLFDLDQHESTEWEPEPLADVLQAWMMPIKKQSRQPACVPLAAAMLARRVLLLLRDITPEGKWTMNDEVQGPPGSRRPGVRYPRTPSSSYAAFEELRQAAVDVLLRRDTAARRSHPCFKALLNRVMFTDGR